MLCMTFRLLKAYPELRDLCVKLGGVIPCLSGYLLVIVLRHSVPDTQLLAGAHDGISHSHSYLYLGGPDFLLPDYTCGQDTCPSATFSRYWSKPRMKVLSDIPCGRTGMLLTQSTLLHGRYI
jgi:hypothetical protein